MDLEPQAPLREKFLPVEMDELAENLIQDSQASLGPDFERFCRLFLALHRTKLAGQVLELKRCYREFDPDRDTVSAKTVSAERRVELRRQLQPKLSELLRQANYVELSPEEFQAALNKTSPRGLQVSVNIDDFDELGLYFRGMGTRVDEMRDWRSLYLKKRYWNTPIYRRLFLFFKLRPDEKNTEQSNFLYLKMFRDVPQSDLEMLLPNTKVRMRVFDKVKLSITGGGGTVSGVMATVTKIGAAANPATWLIAIAGLAGILWRQVTKVFAQRTRYMADLAQQLYFCNLDNNFGALVHLSDLARDEEAKEALLAYTFLATAGNGCNQSQLDQKIEKHLAEVYQVDVDFEIEDGLNKLRRAGFLQDEAGLLRVISPAAAIQMMEEQWASRFAKNR